MKANTDSENTSPKTARLLIFSSFVTDSGLIMLMFRKRRHSMTGHKYTEKEDSNEKLNTG